MSGIKPETIGELLQILEEGREDEIDKKWARDTFQAALEITRLFVLEPKDGTRIIELHEAFKEGCKAVREGKPE